MCTDSKLQKVALVTGGRRGIGLAAVRALGKNGYFVVVSATAREDAKTVGELQKDGIGCAYLPCDISLGEERERLLEEIDVQYGRLDLLVNNAGVAPKVRMDLLDTTEESVDRLLDINLKGTFFMCQGAARRMIAMQGRGLSQYSPRIINISSISAYTSSVSRGEYCISKAGISMMTLLFADRLAEYGIPVFEIRPGIIRTDMTAGVAEQYERLIAGGLTPIRRFGRPEDVADCVWAAASGLLDFATGQVLNADGGFHIRRL